MKRERRLRRMDEIYIATTKDDKYVGDLELSALDENTCITFTRLGVVLGQEIYKSIPLSAFYYIQKTRDVNLRKV